MARSSGPAEKMPSNARPFWTESTWCAPAKTALLGQDASAPLQESGPGRAGAFRCLKGIDLLVRPIRHRSADHVRAHILLCILAYYAEGHMRRSLAPLLFEDEELPRNRKHQEPVAPPQPSASAQRKKIERVTANGFPLHSMNTLDGDSPGFRRCAHPQRGQQRHISTAHGTNTAASPRLGVAGHVARNQKSLLAPSPTPSSRYLAARLFGTSG